MFIVLCIIPTPFHFYYLQRHIIEAIFICVKNLPSIPRQFLYSRVAVGEHHHYIWGFKSYIVIFTCSGMTIFDIFKISTYIHTSVQSCLRLLALFPDEHSLSVCFCVHVCYMSVCVRVCMLLCPYILRCQVV